MPLYHDLADRTAKLIADGVLRPGDRLPSVRQTCRAHGISPVTVTQAYYLLESRGLVDARPKSGYFVRARLGQRLPEPEMSHPVGHSTVLEVSDFIFQILESVKDPSVVPLGSSFPSPYLFPLDKLGRCLAAAARKLDPLATVTDLPPGNEELRRQLSLRYLAQGANVPPQEIVITSGAMEGLNLCLQAVTKPGDLIAIESPTFYAGLQAAERLGLKVIEIPSHPRGGVSLAALEDALRHHPIKACLFMLNFANPTGAYENHLRHLRQTLARQEAALVELVERHFPPDTRLARPSGGYFLWLELPPPADALRLHQQALEQGISIAPGPIFSAKREFGRCIRLNFGHPDPERQKAAVAVLARLVLQ